MKNPFMSMWLSQANRVASAMRGRMTAEVKLQASAAMTGGTRQITDFWTNALSGKTPAAKRRVKRACEEAKVKEIVGW